MRADRKLGVRRLAPPGCTFGTRSFVANITGPQADLNSDTHLFLNSATVDAIQLDPTQAATDTIAYVVTGNPASPPPLPALSDEAGHEGDPQFWVRRHDEYQAFRSPVATASPIPSASEQQQEDDNNQDHFHGSLLFKVVLANAILVFQGAPLQDWADAPSMFNLNARRAESFQNCLIELTDESGRILLADQQRPGRFLPRMYRAFRHCGDRRYAPSRRQKRSLKPRAAG